MTVGKITATRVNFNWTRNFSIFIFLVVILAAIWSTLARIEALGIEARMYYQSYLLRFGLTPTFHVVYFVVLESIVAIAFAATGLVIAWHRPATYMTTLASASLMLYGVTIPPPMHALVVNVPPLPFSLQLIRAIGLGSFIIFFYLFPDGRFTPNWTKGLAIIVAAWTISWSFYPSLNPYNWTGMLPFISLSALLGTGVFAQLYRYFRVSDPERQQQTKWVVFGLTVSVFGDLITHAPWEFFHLQHGPDWYLLMLHHPFFIISQILVPLSIAASILHYGLWEIDFILNRTLLYGLLTAVLAMTLAIFQKTLERIFVGLIGSGAVPLAAGAAVLIVVLLVKPIYSRIEIIISRYLHVQCLDYTQDFVEFLPDVRNAIGFAALVKALAERTVALTNTEHGVVLLGDRSQGLSLVEAYNLDCRRLNSWHLDKNSLERLQRSEVVEYFLDPLFSILIPLSLPRKINPELLGILALGQRTNSRGYSLEEKSALKKLGQQAGLAIYVARFGQSNFTGTQI